MLPPSDAAATDGVRRRVEHLALRLRGQEEEEEAAGEGEEVGSGGGVKRENVVGRGSHPCGTPCACRDGWIKQHDTHHLLLRLSLLLSAFPSATAALRGAAGDQTAASLPLPASWKDAACFLVIEKR